MSGEIIVSEDEVNRLYERLKNDAEACGYHLNPDVSFAMDLVKGIILNDKRYGYWNCPCRLAASNREEDLDIICPCDYRDPDLTEYGTCYCGLYVSGMVATGKQSIGSIPERRQPREKRSQMKSQQMNANLISLPLPVWRCKVCGYLCARDNPPEVCPICKAKKERFERFI
jgi:ferredoxin-thioredoxin reductase catalytic subunit